MTEPSPPTARRSSHPREPLAEITLLKLGGSLLTDKQQRGSARHEVIGRLAREIAAARPAMTDKLLVGHGSGSFGHWEASHHRLREGLREEAQRRGVSATQAAAARLHRLVSEALIDAGETPFSIVPSSTLLTRFGLTRRFALEPLVAALEGGFLPLLYGDVVMDSGQGAAVVSTEAIFASLVQTLPRRRLAVRRVIWAGETTGVHDREGRTVPLLTATTAARLAFDLSGAAGVDVTGGIRLRVDTAARLARRGVTSLLIDGREPAVVERALRGEEVPGTLVVP
ncbi:MAG TPA: isopentenyl phosphate kinase [Thermoanaerobaculia bacterium]|nr:isopentenyl phosphate kinase [Thermoanaerobaculia bacterium]